MGNTRTTTKRSAASRKAWRTRKRMAQARRNKELYGPTLAIFHPLPPQCEAPIAWPDYVNRALPPINFGAPR